MKKIFLLSMLTFVSSLSMSETKVPNWTVQPKEGVVKGDYYKIAERIRQGHLGTLEVVKNNGKLVHVEFNELTRPNYYNRFYQNGVPSGKRGITTLRNVETPYKPLILLRL